MKIFGLIGYPLSHSFSKKYFSEKFENEKCTSEFSYQNFELADLKLFPDLLAANPQLCGLNVTIPYKEKVTEFLNELVYPANEIKAVNTIKIIRNHDGAISSLIGYNTDVIGFTNSIKPCLKENHTGALILGTGGAAKAVAFALQKLNLPSLFVSRTKAENSISYQQLDQKMLTNYPVIINTTPLGTFPDIHSFPPIPYHLVGPGNLLFDLVYNPPLTLFMEKGKSNGATVINGYEMLVGQAEAAWTIWNS